MPDNPVVWIVLIVAAAIVVLFALWQGNIVEVTTKPLGLKFKRKGAGGGDAAGPGVSVGEGMTASGLTVKGDIVGVKTTGGGAAAPDAPVRVLDKAKLEDTTVEGDIAGTKESGRNN